MLHAERVYMLAIDHRWQWEEWCDAQQVSRSRIPEIKNVAWRGFALARERSQTVRTYGALLVDRQYGGAATAAAVAAGVDVGNPAEKAGVFPLEWANDPFWQGLAGSFVKVLVRHRTDHPADVQRAHISCLLELQEWCRAQGKALVAEVLVPRDGEPEGEFEARGRPMAIAAFIRASYARGVEPEFWKIEGTTNASGAATIDAAIRERARCRQLILGKAAGLDTIGEWFAAARRGTSASGFAIGRSVYWSPSVDFVTGKIDAATAAERIAATYLALIAAWEG